MDAVLRGVDLPDLGVVDVRTAAPDLAIALTRGLVAKSYHYVDPNEDVVAVRRRGERTALVVADGHNGHQGSHVAVEALLAVMDQQVPIWSRTEAVHAFHDLNEQIRATRRALPAPHGRTRTTLSLAVVASDAHGQRFMTHCSVGDSAVLVVRGRDVHLLTRDRQHFMGDALSAPLLAGSLDYGQTDLEPDDVVVVVSDGYTHFAPIAAIADVVQSDPAVTARAIVDLAGAGGAGDNVAVAVLGAVFVGSDPARDRELQRHG